MRRIDHLTLEQVEKVIEKCLSCPDGRLTYGKAVVYCSKCHTDSAVFKVERCETLWHILFPQDK